MCALALEKLVNWLWQWPRAVKQSENKRN